MRKEKKEIANIRLITEVQKDFENRKTARRAFELQWQLNIDFLRGNQNNYITKFDTVIPMGKQFYWQEREVFNHISPMIEERLGKLASYKPTISVAPVSSESADIESAKICKKIVQSAFSRNNMEALIERANMWSEMTGTAFYKIVWDSNAGDKVGEIDGKDILSGETSVVVCSPFEIYPDIITAEDIRECRSIIHAKVYRVSEIERIWGVSVAGHEVDVFDISYSGTNRNSRRTIMENAAVVIERYECPSIAYPNGRLVIVAGDMLLHVGDLPYVNHLPFVRQCSEPVAGCFYGKSVIERAIPVQRAYNSVKNRKTEFLNRLACGVLSVEEGSIDLESLENDGLAPGKVLVYRQGTQAPKFVDSGVLPAELEREEERLLREFASISGSIDFIRDAGNSNISGIALQIMVEQESKRMLRIVAQIMRGVAQVGTHILRLSKQFANSGRFERIASGDNVQTFYWNAADITSDEVTVTSAQEPKEI